MFQPLQLSEIKAYADDRQLPGYERTEFREFVQFLDKIYMEHMDRKTSSAPQRPPGK